MVKDLVSIIMPAYNAEKYIAEAINSVLKQTYINWELIIVDDGSTDLTANIIKEFVKQDKRLSYYYQPNGKQGKARNLGINHSKGEYLSFLDADDLWTVDKLSSQIKLLASDIDLDLIFSQGYSLHQNQVIDCNLTALKIWDLSDFPVFIKHNQIPILSVLARKTSIEKVGNFSERVDIQNAEDYHLWLKMLINGCKFKSIVNRLFYYRVHENQSTFQNINLELPLLSTYIAVYQQLDNSKLKKQIIEKIKWFVFKKDNYAICIDLICFHFKQKRLNILSIFIKTFLRGEKILQRKIVFQLISNFG